MLPGPDQIVACPHCQGLAKYSTLLSGNSIGARIWTDGRQKAPMLPSPPAVVQCRHCAEPYWLVDAKEIGTLPLWGDDSRTDPLWRKAEYVADAPEAGYYKALKTRLAHDRALEKMFRTFVWWRGNDADRILGRDEEGIETPHPEAFRDNLTALAQLFNEKSPDELIMKAEALRELAEFEASLKILEGIEGQDYDTVVHLLRELCERADPTVREIGSDA